MTSSHLINRFDLLKKNIEERNNFQEFLQTLSRYTPKTVEMHNCHVDELRDCVIDNLFKQHLTLETQICKLLVDFLSNDFNDVTKKTYLEILIHYAKMDVEGFLERWSSTGGKPTQAQLFNNLIKEYLMKALMPAEGIKEIVPASSKMKEFVVTSLLSNAILQAFQSCLKDCLEFPSSIEWIRKQISSMKIYIVEHFVPLVGIRGACLIDGIVICIGNLARSPDSEEHQADLITLACHECGDYLARVSCNNFNFSSPYKLLSDQRNVRKDVVNPELNLELGRAVELYLFDKIQPNWSLSSKHAAIEFLSRLRIRKTYPIIRNDEFEDLGLVRRADIDTSLTFGMDITEFDYFF